MSDPDPSIWEKFAMGALAIVNLLFGWLYAGINKRIDHAQATADGALDKAEFYRSLASAIEDRRELRDELHTHRLHITKLFDELTVIRRDISDNQEKLLNAIHDSRGVRQTKR